MNRRRVPKTITQGGALLIVSAFLCSMLFLFPLQNLPVSYAQTSPALGFVGNMLPAGGTIFEVDSFSINIEAYKAGVTDQIGQGNDIRCNVYWSPVTSFGSDWLNPVTTPMNYAGDVANNDEYGATLFPGIGTYEYTTNCEDLTTDTVVWQQDGNGQLTVNNDRNALWVDQTTIAWNSFGYATYELHGSRDGQLNIPMQVGAGIPLNFSRKLQLGDYPKTPNLSNYDAWTIPAEFIGQIPDLLKGEVAIAAYDRSGFLRDASRLQLQGVLDDMYTYTGELGVVYAENQPSLHLWAPTAQSVVLQRFTSPDPTATPITNPMTLDSTTGVWSITGDPDWDKQYYRYDIQVFVPDARQIERNLVTDPYSLNLSQNSQLSQILDIYNDPTLKPAGWDSLPKPSLEAPEDIAVYEVHVRDFSANDTKVAAQEQGKFKAFTYDGTGDRPLSDGMKHLLNLANAGLTHVHLLPAFDIASVNEDPTQQQSPDPAVLATFAPDSPKQQEAVTATRGLDAFNWGYDPFHYGAAEGSYATNANDTSRVLEFREMVQALNRHNLGVVMDVVYNHTAASGQFSDSVLDRVVPGYYYRYDNNGFLQTSSCCSDTATEFNMMEKLMVDTVLIWAKAYKVDGFRFDLMNLHTVKNMQVLRDAVQSLTLENDGVDGQRIYLYGEGWDFGSAQGKFASVQSQLPRNPNFLHANQFNVGGTGIGTFNDKIRDAVHGGFGDKTRQGFSNGQAYDWNGYRYSNRGRGDLRFSMDRVRVGLAGNLRNYRFTDQAGRSITGEQLAFTGYALDPEEVVNYATKHDNETLYDLNVFKLPLGQGGTPITPMADRVRVQNMNLSVIGLSQGIPFFHMGSDMLRSKSLDRNSYDSGDWFNRVDFTYNTNHFGSGLPPSFENARLWGFMGPFLRNQSLVPTSTNIDNSVNHLQEILAIRKSSKLFRLETADAIQDRVKFLNTGPGQQDALIVMSLQDGDGEEDLDPTYDQVVVLFNANKFGQTFTVPSLAGAMLELHPVQVRSQDPIVQTANFDSTTGTFSIPARTTAVFVLPQTP